MKDISFCLSNVAKGRYLQMHRRVHEFVSLGVLSCGFGSVIRGSCSLIAGGCLCPVVQVNFATEAFQGQKTKRTPCGERWALRSCNLKVLHPLGFMIVVQILEMRQNHYHCRLYPNLCAPWPRLKTGTSNGLHEV